MAEKFVLFGTWESGLLLDEFLWANVKANQNLVKLCPIERTAQFIWKDGIHYLFFGRNYLDELGKWCSEKESDLAFFHKHQNKFQTAAEIVKKKIEKVTRVTASQLSDEELAGVVSKTRTFINDITPFDQLGMIAEPIYTEKLLKIIDKSKIAQVTMPPWPSTTMKEELAVISTCLEIINKQTGSTAFTADEIATKHLNKLKKLTSEYGFIPVFLFNQSWGVDYYALQISEKIKKGKEKLEQRKGELENFGQSTLDKSAPVLKGINSNLPEIIQIFSFTRNEAELVLSYGQHKLQPFYKEIYKRLCITNRQLRMYTESELYSAVIQRKANEPLLNERLANGAGMHTDASTGRLMDAKEIKTALENVEKIESKLQLLCACPGKVSGKVRIVRSPEDIENFEQGEVLIALWTCVDYLPAMKKAAAFITEGGGITCHAAVIARELNTPCIIGYKNATKLFKNGDDVEVDTERLSVKKI